MLVVMPNWSKRSITVINANQSDTVHFAGSLVLWVTVHMGFKFGLDICTLCNTYFIRACAALVHTFSSLDSQYIPRAGSNRGYSSKLTLAFITNKLCE